MMKTNLVLFVMLGGLLSNASEAGDCKIEKSSWVGSYYHKLLSPIGFYGFSGLVILPGFHEDRTCTVMDRSCRYYSTAPDLGAPVAVNGQLLSYFDQSLDASSVYIGCSKESAEIDAGLNWEPISREGKLVWVPGNLSPEESRNPSQQYLLDKDSSPPTLSAPDGRELARDWPAVRAKISELRLRQFSAFVPFWRTTDWNADPQKPFLPAEEVRLEITTRGDGNFRLKIVSVSHPEFSIDQSFHYAAAKDGDGKGYACKRVNSIDQFVLIKPGTIVGNEKGFIPDAKVQATQAHTTEAWWKEVRLVRKNGSKAAFAPPFCTWVRGADTWPRYEEIFLSSGLDDETGAEKVSIKP